MTKDLLGHSTKSRFIDGEEYHVIETHRTLSAVQVRDGDNEFWLPLSQIYIESCGPTKLNARGKPETPVTITVPDWLAKEKGLME